MASRRPYRTDLPDEPRALIEPTLTARRATRRGPGIEQPAHDLPSRRTRRAAGRRTDPTAAIIDAQTAPASTAAESGQGHDADERAFGWPVPHRRSARDHEAHPGPARSMAHRAIDLVSRRLTGENTPTRRDAPTEADTTSAT
ncbi:hypothetical protein [Nocardiopsis lambiniae]|uniref:Uncharacterized protein n=1 Tax=Nocardiopsis lambiniae TaxID=3075539 RepID=A0ABU2M5Z6_9ACTN|nr:hypothetical protein [Nocardiopsis sp. DSM 44743]MDT0327605.1 hypothetical protein [Nocardiopsis sp. DSM 44743]